MTVMQSKYAEQVQRPEDLITANMQLVRKLAFYFHSRVRGAVEVDDLIQIGYMGLIDASQKYERHEGVTFTCLCINPHSRCYFGSFAALV